MIPKFRAWDKTTNQMRGCYGFNELEQEVYVCSVADDEFNGRLKTVHALRKSFDEVILMQYTGLKDKNGVEIYEHDILKNGNGKIGEVIYLQQEVGYVVSLKRSDYRLGHRNTGEGYKIANDHTVIGNIYENPGLLEVTK